MIKKNTLRPLGASEKAFWILDQVSPVHFVMAIEITGIITLPELNKAAAALQRRHILLNVVIDGSNNLIPVFREIKGAAIPIRHLPNGGDLAAEMSRELAIPFDYNNQLALRLVLINDDQTSRLILVMEHTMGDGMSGIYLLNDLLQLLTGSALTPLPLPPSIDELISSPVLPDMSNKDERQILSQVAVSEPFIHLLSLSKTLTDRLIRAAKARQTSVHGAICAAAVIALRQRDAAWADNPIRLVSPVSFRKTLDVANTAGLYFGAETIIYDPDEEGSFWEMARYTRVKLKDAAEPETIREGYMPIQQWLFSGASLSELSNGLQGTVIPRELMVSNLGAWPFPTNFGDLTVKTIHGPLALSCYPAEFTIGVITSQGRLGLSLATRENVPDFLRTIGQLLEIVC